MKKILVTGAGGFVGHNLVKKLLSEGKEVWGIVRPGDRAYNHFKDDKFHIEYMDLLQAMNHVKDFPAGQIDTMYHFAWTGVKPEERNNLDVQIMNIEMSLSCMRLAVAIGIRKIIFPGSTNEYLYYGKPLNKDAVPSPNNSYGAVKIALRYLCYDFAVQNSISFIYTIIAGIYAEDRRDNNVIFYTIEKLLRKEKPLLTKLEQPWDYVHIDDALEALYLVGEKGRGDKVYAIGHGDNWKLFNYIEIISKKIDSSLPLGIGEKPYQDGRIPSSCIDLTDIENDTGFKPRIDFESGIARVIDKVRKDIVTQ